MELIEKRDNPSKISTDRLVKDDVMGAKGSGANNHEDMVQWVHHIYLARIYHMMHLDHCCSADEPTRFNRTTRPRR